MHFFNFQNPADLKFPLCININKPSYPFRVGWSIYIIQFGQIWATTIHQYISKEFIWWKIISADSCFYFILLTKAIRIYSTITLNETSFRLLLFNIHLLQFDFKFLSELNAVEILFHCGDVKWEFLTSFLFKNLYLFTRAYKYSFLHKKLVRNIIPI